jgi:hypothetical protein
VVFPPVKMMTCVGIVLGRFWGSTPVAYLSSICWTVRATSRLSSMMSRVLSPDERGAGRRAACAPRGRLHPAASVAVLTRTPRVSARRVTTVPHAARRCPTRGWPDSLSPCKAGCGVCLTWAAPGRTRPGAPPGRSMAVRGRRYPHHGGQGAAHSPRCRSPPRRRARQPRESPVLHGPPQEARARGAPAGTAAASATRAGPRVAPAASSLEARVGAWGDAPKRGHPGRGASAREAAGDGGSAGQGQTRAGGWARGRRGLGAGAPGEAQHPRGLAPEPRPQSRGCCACVHHGRKCGTAWWGALMAWLVCSDPGIQ